VDEPFAVEAWGVGMHGSTLEVEFDQIAGSD
jgi:hypothetical protein